MPDAYGDTGEGVIVSTLGSSGDSPYAADEAEDKPEKKDKDRGEATAMIGEMEFVAESASAKLKDGKLKLSFSRIDTVDGKMNRQAFSLIIDDYKGPGEYTTQNMMSNYSGVGFDVERAKKAVDEDGKTDDAKVQAQVMDTMKKSQVILLRGAKINVTSATEDEYVGTFSWDGTGHPGKPKVTDGKFRARVRKKKK